MEELSNRTLFRKMEQRIMKLEMDGDVMILGCRMRT